LAGPGLARDDVQPGRQLQLGVLDDTEPLDPDSAEHVGSLRRATVGAVHRRRPRPRRRDPGPDAATPAPTPRPPAPAPRPRAQAPPASGRPRHPCTGSANLATSRSVN